MWTPQPGPQYLAIAASFVEELLFGGARGGGKRCPRLRSGAANGKTDYLLGDYGFDVPTYGSAWKGVIFRRSYPQFEHLISRARQIYINGYKLDGRDIPPWYPGTVEKKKPPSFEFPNGATLLCRYIEVDEDVDEYSGHEFSWLGYDELGLWASDKPYNQMLATLRSPHDIPTKRVRASAMPGGPGNSWIKKRWIDAAPDGGKLLTNIKTGGSMMFIRSRVWDNKILLKADPRYPDRLKGVGSPELVKAWLDGDWSVVMGAYFSGFSYGRHVVEPHEIPKHWLRFRSCDWGSASPFSVGWWAVSDGGDYETFSYPDGALINYREWYGAKESGGGLKLDADAFTQGIFEREMVGEKFTYSVADPSIFRVDGGPSIGERMSRKGISWRSGTRARVHGWDQIRSRLSGGDDGRPMIYFFSTCTDIIRTLPAVQHSRVDPEDVHKGGEDHCFTGDTKVDTDQGPIKIVDMAGVCEYEHEVIKARVTNTQIAEVYTLNGIEWAFNARQIGGVAEVLRVSFEDGRYIDCTPDHKFMTENGWVPALDLTDEMSYDIDLWKVRSRYLATLSRNIEVFGITGAGRISKERAFAFIGRFGRISMAPFRKAHVFIMKTTTEAITRFPICGSWAIPSTESYTQITKIIRGLYLKRPAMRLEGGMEARKASSGTERTTKKTCVPSWRRGLLRYVNSVVRHIWLLGPKPILVNGAGIIVRLVRCVSVEKLNGKQAVYCLTVPETGHFTVNGGIVVANCADQVRYACMSRPWITRLPQFRGPLTAEEPTLDELMDEYDKKLKSRHRI